MSIYLHYGSRSAQPVRLRAFIELAVQRLADSKTFVLTAKQLAGTEAKGRKAHRLRKPM